MTIFNFHGTPLVRHSVPFVKYDEPIEPKDIDAHLGVLISRMRKSILDNDVFQMIEMHIEDQWESHLLIRHGFRTDRLGNLPVRKNVKIGHTGTYLLRAQFESFQKILLFLHNEEYFRDYIRSAYLDTLFSRWISNLENSDLERYKVNLDTVKQYEEQCSKHFLEPDELEHVRNLFNSSKIGEALRRYALPTGKGVCNKLKGSKWEQLAKRLHVEYSDLSQLTHVGLKQLYLGNSNKEYFSNPVRLVGEKTLAEVGYEELVAMSLTSSATAQLLSHTIVAFEGKRHSEYINGLATAWHYFGNAGIRVRSLYCLLPEDVKDLLDVTWEC